MMLASYVCVVSVSIFPAIVADGSMDMTTRTEGFGERREGDGEGWERDVWAGRLGS